MHRCREGATGSFDGLSPSFLITKLLGSCGASCQGGLMQIFPGMLHLCCMRGWWLANGHQRLTNNDARALINVIVMLDPYNIWKPPCWNWPWPFSPIPYSKYFPLLYPSLRCIAVWAMFSHSWISVSIADTILAYLYVSTKIRKQATVL